MIECPQIELIFYRLAFKEMYIWFKEYVVISSLYIWCYLLMLFMFALCYLWWWYGFLYASFILIHLYLFFVLAVCPFPPHRFIDSEIEKRERELHSSMRFETPFGNFLRATLNTSPSIHPPTRQWFLSRYLSVCMLCCLMLLYSILSSLLFLCWYGISLPI